MRRIRLWILPVACLSLLVLASVSWAGIYWESEVVSKGMPGSAGGTRIEKHYLTPEATRVELGNGMVMITNYDTMTMYQLNPASKTYSETRLNQLAEQFKGKEGEAARKMMGQMGQSTQVVPTGETKTVEGYNCQKYNVSFMGMTGEYWVSKDVKGYEEMKAVSRKVAEKTEKIPMMKQMGAMEFMTKMEGFPVQMTMKMMGGQTVSTLKKVEQREFSDDLFKVPAEYTLKQSPHS